jgi:DNA-binding transcriptional ArsR family regulator
MATNFRTLDLNLLRVFDEVMAERSLTRAARNLNLTQPAVSNALRRLRETLGDELVQRSGQGMAPTTRALAIWPTVREALATLPDIYREIISLYHYEHLLYREIAELLDLPLGTVMNRLFRARQRLKDKLVGLEEVHVPARAEQAG